MLVQMDNGRVMQEVEDNCVEYGIEYTELRSSLQVSSLHSAPRPIPRRMCFNRRTRVGQMKVRLRVHQPHGTK